MFHASVLTLYPEMFPGPLGLSLAGDHRRATRAEYEAKNLHIEGDAP